MDHLTLHTGDQLPQVGLGFWKTPNPLAADLVQQALQVGYRHLDCACDYGNETEVGDGIRQAIDDAICQREDLWVTSKLWNTYHAAEHVRPACERSLHDLKLDYLDLYLIHFPIALEFVPFEKRYPPEWFYDPEADEPTMRPTSVPLAETWRAMEQLVRDGLVKHIGVCNFGCSLLRDLLSYAEIPPAVLQIESHPYLVQEKLVRFCGEQGIAVTAFSPLGAPSYLPLGMANEGESVLRDPVVEAIAAEHNRTPAQVVLRWGVQRPTAIVPKTTRRERLEENIGIFDFELTDQQMQAISNLDRHRRFNDPGEFCESAFNTFFPIYE